MPYLEVLKFWYSEESETLLKSSSHAECCPVTFWAVAMLKKCALISATSEKITYVFVSEFLLEGYLFYSTQLNDPVFVGFTFAKEDLNFPDTYF